MDIKTSSIVRKDNKIVHFLSSFGDVHNQLVLLNGLIEHKKLKLQLNFPT